MNNASPVAVVGGGPAGSVAALSLARLGHAVVLLERTAEDRAPEVAGSASGGRVGEALPPDVKPLFQGLGLWEAFVREGHLEAHGVRSSWGSRVPSERSFLSNPYGHGWHVDRDRFDAWLLAAAAEAGVEVRRGVEVLDASMSEGGVLMRCRVSGRFRDVTAAAVVDASGRASIVARRLGARRRRDDRLIAFVTRWHAATTDQDGRLVVEADVDGWWYSALTSDRRRVVVYLTDTDCPSARRARSASGYMSLLQETREVRAVTIGADVGGCARPLVRAAGTSWLQPTSGPGWMAAGDAAAAFDPLSSQGMTVGMEAGHRAAHALYGPRDDYDGWIRDVLADYLEQRRRIYGSERRWPTTLFWARRHSDGLDGGKW